MLNRRLLRTKVVHAVYASRLAYEANILLAHDQLAAVFSPDLNSMQVQDKVLLETKRMDAVALFNAFVEESDQAAPSKFSNELAPVVRRTYEQFVKDNHSDQQFCISQTVRDTMGIFDQFLTIAQLLIELGHLSKNERTKPVIEPESAFPRSGGLDSNSILLAIENCTPLKVAVARKGISWANNLALVRKLYRESLKKDDAYTLYCQKAEHSPDEDHDMMQHILRRLLFKQEAFVEYMEQADRYWETSNELVRSLCIKFLKAAHSQPNELELPKFSDDWDDDRSFMEELYGQAIQNDRQYAVYLKEQLLRWDLDRVSVVDLVVLKVALAELIHSPGIPTKVTINEYIEIAKQYSTPNSGKFVNGILDVLAEKLQAEGIIRKSGRGLLDNK